MKQLYRFISEDRIPFMGDDDYPKFDFPNITLVLQTYNVWKETPKGYWYGYGTQTNNSLRGEARWVSKNARKRFVYPTKEEALDNYIKRTEKRVKILSYQVSSCEMGLAQAKKYTILAL